MIAENKFHPEKEPNCSNVPSKKIEKIIIKWSPGLSTHLHR